MNFIKKQCISRQLRSFIRQKNDRAVKIHSLKNANSICFFTSNDDSKRMRDLIHYVSANHRKKMIIICYHLSKKTIKNSNSFPFLYTISPKEISITGQIKGQISDIFSQHYNIFIDLDTKTDLTSLYLKTLPKADFRIGGCQEYYNYFDFTLCTNKQHTMKGYLSNLEIYTSKLKGY